MAWTDPSKYCKDVDAYERGLVTAINRLDRLMIDGYVCDKPCRELWMGLLRSLYGKELGNGQ